MAFSGLLCSYKGGKLKKTKTYPFSILVPKNQPRFEYQSTHKKLALHMYFFNGLIFTH